MQKERSVGEGNHRNEVDWKWEFRRHTHTITLEVFPFKKKAVFLAEPSVLIGPFCCLPEESWPVQFCWFGSQPSSQGSGFNLKCNVSERVAPGRRAPYCSVFHCPPGSVPLLCLEHPPQPHSVMEPFWISEVFISMGRKNVNYLRRLLLGTPM